MNYKDVSVVMITKNEEKSVKKVILDIKKHVYGAEILFIDSSTDRTPIIARKLGAKVLRQYPPKGYGPAMIKALLTPKRDIIVTMDCDNTYPVNNIPYLIKKIKQGYDLVGTTRISNGKPRYMPFFNYVVNKIFNWVASFLFWRKIQDVHTGMRAYRRKMLHSISWEANASALPVELLVKPIQLGYAYFEVPIEYKQRSGFTTLDRFNSTIWTFKRMLKIRFENKKTFLVATLLLLISAFFIINNYIKYFPSWGYDATLNIQMIMTLAKTGKYPNSNYHIATYPPLFYLISASIYKVFENMKFVQLISLASFASMMILFYKSISLYSKKIWLLFSFTILFIFLPVSLNYAYMIYSYPLGHLFSLLTIFIILLTIHQKKISLKTIVYLSFVTSFGVLTSLTNLATIPLCIFFVIFFPYVKIIQKIKYMIIFITLVSIVVLPYFKFRESQFKCFFCAPNKGNKTAISILNTYPDKFFQKFNLNSFNQPYASSNFSYQIKKAGFWTTLHMTLFSDFWNYLVDNKYSRDSSNKQGLIFTKPHYVDEKKIFNLKIMNYLGLPIALLLISTSLNNLYKGVTFFLKRNKEYFDNFIVSICVLIFFIQFIVYILQYPMYANIHAGYIFPAVFILLVSSVKILNNNNNMLTRLIVMYIIGYSLFSFLTFYII